MVPSRLTSAVPWQLHAVRGYERVAFRLALARAALLFSRAVSSRSRLL